MKSAAIYAVSLHRSENGEMLFTHLSICIL